MLQFLVEKPFNLNANKSFKVRVNRIQMSNLNSPMLSTFQPNGIEKKKKNGSSAGHLGMELFPLCSKRELKLARFRPPHPYNVISVQREY